MGVRGVARMSPIWVLTDGAAGNRRQALALAEALGDEIREMTNLAARPPWSWLAPHALLGGRQAWPIAVRAQLRPPWPGLAIGCGRQAALATRMLRRLAGPRLRTVQILDPRADPRHWDVVVAPQHDALTGINVLTPLGSLNPVDDTWLADARAAWAELGLLPSPRIGVLLGGPRRGIALDAPWREALSVTLHALLGTGGSLLLVASRRTPPELVEACMALAPATTRRLWRGVQDGANPYPGVLAWSDRLLVSPDSVNMLSEAAATGIPVHSVVTGTLPARLARFHQGLRDGGWLVEAGEALHASAPLRETAAVAAAVRGMLDLG